MTDRRTARSRTPQLWMVFGVIALVVVVIDQVSKAWIESSFALATYGVAPGSAGAPTPIIGDLLRIARSWNDGGIFGMLGDSGLYLGIASLGVIAVIIVIEARQGVHNLWLTVALGLLLGGAVGNLIDRLRFGHVVDWVDAGIGDLRFYTFNVADAAISLSVLLLLAIGILGPRLTGTGRQGAAGSSADATLADGGRP
jgi:signal peptidase II